MNYIDLNNDTISKFLTIKDYFVTLSLVSLEQNKLVNRFFLKKINEELKNIEDCIKFETINRSYFLKKERLHLGFAIHALDFTKKRQRRQTFKMLVYKIAFMNNEDQIRKDRLVVARVADRMGLMGKIKKEEVVKVNQCSFEMLMKQIPNIRQREADNNFYLIIKFGEMRYPNIQDIEARITKFVDRFTVTKTAIDDALGMAREQYKTTQTPGLKQNFRIIRLEEKLKIVIPILEKMQKTREEEEG